MSLNSNQATFHHRIVRDSSFRYQLSYHRRYGNPSCEGFQRDWGEWKQQKTEICDQQIFIS